MSGLKGYVVAIVLSMGVGPEWHQRTGIVKRGAGLYDLFPGHPDAGMPTRLQFVPRPYEQNNAREGVTPEALLFTAMHHLQAGETDGPTLEAITHIEAALAALHKRV